MKRLVVVINVLFISFVCRAEVTFHPVVLDDLFMTDEAASGYSAMYCGVRFANRFSGIMDAIAYLSFTPDRLVTEYGNTWLNLDYSYYYQGAPITTKENFLKISPKWQEAFNIRTASNFDDELRAFAASAGGALFTTKRFQLFVAQDQIAAITFNEIDTTLDGYPIGMVIKVAPTSRHCVAVGIFKRDGNYHVITMDPVAGSTVFSNSRGPARTELERVLERMLTPPAKAVTPPLTPSPTASDDSLEGFGGVQVLADGFVYDPRDFERADSSSRSPVGSLPRSQTDSSPRSRVSSREGNDGFEAYDSRAFRDDDYIEPNVTAFVSKFFEQGIGGSQTFLGLKNNGNTCYQNAALQAIFWTPFLRKALNDGFKARALDNGATSLVIRKFFSIMRRLERPWEELPGDKKRSDVPEGRDAYWYLNPMPFNVGIQTKFPFFEIGVQQDAMEFLQNLWGLFESNNVFPTPISFDDGLHGIIEQTVMRCREDGCTAGERRSPDPAPLSFLLSLNIPPGGEGAFTMQELFDFSKASSHVAEIDCAACARKTIHDNRSFVKISPNQSTLIVHIKRFGYHAETHMPFKLQTAVTFPDDSGVVDFVDSEGLVHRYRVVSIIVQSGSLSSGHYWTITRQGIFNDKRAFSDQGQALRELLVTGEINSVRGWPQATGYIYFLERIVPAGFDEEKPAGALVRTDDAAPVVGYDDDEDDEDND